MRVCMTNAVLYRGIFSRSRAMPERELYDDIHSFTEAQETAASISSLTQHSRSSSSWDTSKAWAFTDENGQENRSIGPAQRRLSNRTKETSHVSSNPFPKATNCCPNDRAGQSSFEFLMLQASSLSCCG